MTHKKKKKKMNVPDWNYENRQEPMLGINFTPSGNKISVYVWIKRPEVLRALGDDYRKEYTELKLKDVIDFMTVFNSCIEKQPQYKQNLEIYYINPYEKDNRITTKNFIKQYPQMVEKHKICVDSLLDFLDKREKQNQELKKFKGDFK